MRPINPGNSDPFAKHMSKRCKSPVIGLTGNSGSGKSTVANLLERHGAFVIDTDKIARKAVEDSVVLDSLRRVFGDAVFDAEGIFDRKKTALLVFNDQERLARLTEITHEYIIREVYCSVAAQQELNLSGCQTEKDAARIIVIDAPIPVEKGFLDIADEVWVVVSELRYRLDRVAERDGLTEEEALSRFHAQLSDHEYRKLADCVLENNGTLQDLEMQALRQMERFLAAHE